MTIALRLAGFEIRDVFMWLYSNGFPKSLNVSKALKSSGASDEARRWEGWGTATKPAYEPAILARKPLSGTVASCVLEHNTGAINIDASRVGDEGGTRVETEGETPYNGALAGDKRHVYGGCIDRGRGSPIGKGRWPTNVMIDEHVSRELGERGRYFHTPKASPAEREAGLGDFEKRRANTHPTVKPIELMRYLVRMVTPPEGLVLDPFAGSGSTLCAAALEGFECLGIEREEEYVAIARARVAHWEAERSQGQLSLFESEVSHE